MPARLLYDFVSYKGTHWYVQLDEANTVVFAESNPENAPIEQQVTEAELNSRKIGQVLYSYCSGTTFIKVIVTNLYPFAKFEQEINSRACGGVPPVDCTFSKFNTAVTNETEAGRKDGTITIDAELVGHVLEYSLDGLNWQDEPVFRNLVPGAYTVRARSTTADCINYAKVNIIAGLAPVVIPYPYKEKVCKSFRLIQDGVVYLIDEPIQWDNIEFEGNRDLEGHGWKSQYAEGEFQLQFACDSGKAIIQAEHDLHGNDGYTQFQYGWDYQGTFQVLFDGKLNYNTYKKQRSWIEINVESTDHNDTLDSRNDTKVSLAEGKTQDGNFIQVPRVYPVSLHGKAIATSYIVQNNDQVEHGVFSIRQARSYIVPDTSNAKTTEIADVNPIGLLIFNEAPYDVEGLHAIDIKYAGNYNFQRVKFTIDVKVKGRRGNQGWYTFKPIFMIGDTQYAAGPTITGQTSATEWTSVPVNFEYSGQHRLGAGTQVYWFIQMDTRDFVEGPSLMQRSIDIAVQALEESAGSWANAWMIKDVFDYVTRNITDNRTYLKSTFLAERNAQQAFDGEGALNALTNGKQIRRFDPNNHPLKISLKELKQLVKSLWCCGWNLEKIGGYEYLAVERVNYFYQNRKICQIDEVEEYYEEVARDLIYNEAEFGYDKFQEEGVNTLDEYNTKHEVLLPIKTHKNKLVVKSPAIASGYSIEKCRRNQFADTPQDSVENDEDTFIISVNKNFVGGSYSAEKNEAFDIADNVISPETSYNLRLTPKRMEVNWAVWIKNILHYKQQIDEVRTNLVIQNGKLRTKLKMTDLRPVGDIFKDLWVEDQNIQNSAYPVQERLWQPTYIYTKMKLTPDLHNLIDKAMRGQAAATQNYGWVAVKDNDGLYQAGYPMQVKYNFHEEYAQLKLLKAANSPVNPDEECCNYLSINGCVVKINGNKVTIR
jgi:hypothetical protein